MSTSVQQEKPQTVERTAILLRAEMAADGYRWLHLRASQRGDVALRGT